MHGFSVQAEEPVKDGLSKYLYGRLEHRDWEDLVVVVVVVVNGGGGPRERRSWFGWSGWGGEKGGKLETILGYRSRGLRGNRVP